MKSQSLGKNLSLMKESKKKAMRMIRPWRSGKRSCRKTRPKMVHPKLKKLLPEPTIGI